MQKATFWLNILTFIRMNKVNTFIGCIVNHNNGKLIACTSKIIFNSI